MRTSEHSVAIATKARNKLYSGSTMLKPKGSGGGVPYTNSVTLNSFQGLSFFIPESLNRESSLFKSDKSRLEAAPTGFGIDSCRSTILVRFFIYHFEQRF
jgi:hypothetical protein